MNFAFQNSVYGQEMILKLDIDISEIVQTVF